MGRKQKGQESNPVPLDLHSLLLLSLMHVRETFDYFDRNFRGAGGTTAALPTFNVIQTTGENEVNSTGDDGRDE
jgi:hypothetical protein